MKGTTRSITTHYMSINRLESGRRVQCCSSLLSVWCWRSFCGEKL